MKPAPAHPRRLVYLGTPQAAVPPLRALHAAGYDLPLVVSRADTRRGRGGALVPSPVKAAALDLGIPVTDRVDDVLAVGADLGVVVAFGRIIRPHVLAELPMINLHFSLLPRWRGAAPVERAILAGDPETGVCVMAVEEGLDTGGVHRRAVVPVGSGVTADELRAELTEVGTRLLLEALAEGLGTPEPQTGEVTYAEKIDPAELAIDWARDAVAVDRLVRIGDAWTLFRGRRLKVWRTRPVPAPGGPANGGPAVGGPAVGGPAVGGPGPGELRGLLVGTGDGALELLEVQPEGKGRQPADAWRNGARPLPGERLGA